MVQGEKALWVKLLHNMMPNTPTAEVYFFYYLNLSFPLFFHATLCLSPAGLMLSRATRTANHVVIIRPGVCVGQRERERERERERAMYTIQILL